MSDSFEAADTQVDKVPFEARPEIYNWWAGNIGAAFAAWKTLPTRPGSTSGSRRCAPLR